MATRQGSLVKLYLYKGVWSLAWTGVGDYFLRVGGTLTGSINTDATTIAQIQTELDTILGATNCVVTGSNFVSPYTITLAVDYLFSGVGFEVASTTATTMAVTRTFPAVPEAHTEGNGYYLMGSEHSLAKSMDLEIQDITNKESGQWKESIGQIRTIALNPSHYFLTEKYFSALYNQYKIAQPIIVFEILPTQTFTTQDDSYGIYNILNLTENSTQNTVVDFTANFELTGEPTEINATS